MEANFVWTCSSRMCLFTKVSLTCTMIMKVIERIKKVWELSQGEGLMNRTSLSLLDRFNYGIRGYSKKSVSWAVQLFFVGLYCCFTRKWCINNDWEYDFWKLRWLFYQCYGVFALFSIFLVKRVFRIWFAWARFSLVIVASGIYWVVVVVVFGQLIFLKAEGNAREIDWGIFLRCSYARWVSVT